MIWYYYVFLIVAFLLIGIVLMQCNKSDNQNNAITGGRNLSIFAKMKERGVDKFLSYFTFFLVSVFFCFSLYISINA